MKHKIDLKWQDKMSFETELDGHPLVLDASEDVGGSDSGPRPKKLMLVALAGCTGMDVVSILKKMRVNVDSFNVEVEANMTEEHPKKYTEMKIIYRFKGKNLPIEKLEKAVGLSEDRYCGVSATLSGSVKLTSEIVIE
ncbi:OsmC family peroxiredoxin [Prolixibacteraceae bacterium JC049]|nr:OsmC family peroxiredoxin [Prolixibacteraceae bacterium JC049]